MVNFVFIFKHSITQWFFAFSHSFHCSIFTCLQVWACKSLAWLFHFTSVGKCISNPVAFCLLVIAEMKLFSLWSSECSFDAVDVSWRTHGCCWPIISKFMPHSLSSMKRQLQICDRNWMLPGHSWRSQKKKLLNRRHFCFTCSKNCWVSRFWQQNSWYLCVVKM